MALDIGTKIENEGKNSQGRLSAAEFNQLVDTVNTLEKNKLDGIILKEKSLYGTVGGQAIGVGVDLPDNEKSLGGLTNVNDNVDNATNGSLLIKGENEWSSIPPVLNSLSDYDNMLMPVYHRVLGKWVFISVSSITGGVTPPVALEMILNTGVLNVNKLA